MFKKLKDAFFSEGKGLEEKVFSVILHMGAIIVLISCIFTCAEKISQHATMVAISSVILYAIAMVVHYKCKKSDTIKAVCLLLINCVIMPVMFFSCGGIDSGMPLYMLAGLFIIVPTLQGKARRICLCISTIVQLLTVAVSYYFMNDHLNNLPLDKGLLAQMSLEARVVDMLMSMFLISVFVCVTSGLILKAYQVERGEKERLLERLEYLSRVDELTGLYNRRELFWHLDTMERFWEKHYYILMLDVDHFKRINDKYGHLFGDRTLKRIAGVIHNMTKGEDEIAARYGGEEFVILYKAYDMKEALVKAEMLRKRVERMSWKGCEDLVITISGGLVACSGFRRIEPLLAAADKYLYQAKKGGRNRICHGEDMIPMKKQAR